MKKIFTYLFIVIFCGALAVGCESQLDIEKTGNMGTLESFYQTDDDAEQAAMAMYVGIDNMYMAWFLMLNILSDDVWCGGGSRGDQSVLEELNEYNYPSDNSYVTNLYRGLYRAIYYANLVLDNLPSDSSVKQRAIAEAHFFRAWCHFYLVTLWGTAPAVDHVLTASEYKQPNGTVSETWALIEQDLTTAINSGNLPSKTSVNDEDTGRVTKEAAQALLGKAYVFQGKYSEAASMLDNVINSGLYALYTGDYGDLLHVTCNNCCEWIFQLQKRNDSSNIGDMWNGIWVYCGWRTDLLNLGDWSDVFVMNTYGFCCPQKDLYDAFVEMEGEDGYRLNQSIITFEQLLDMGITIMDGRYIYGAEGSEFWKMRPLQSDQVMTGNPYRQWINSPIMRYAEVLLLAAEANFQSGSTGKALDYLNQIRRRAQLPDLASIDMDAIKNEKRLELCMEAVRYQDLIRWGDAESKLKEQGHIIPSTSYENGEIVINDQFINTSYGFQSKHKLLPFPANEMQVNENMVQNEGW